MVLLFIKNKKEFKRKLQMNLEIAKKMKMFIKNSKKIIWKKWFLLFCLKKKPRLSLTQIFQTQIKTSKISPQNKKKHPSQWVKKNS